MEWPQRSQKEVRGWGGAGCKEAEPAKQKRKQSCSRKVRVGWAVAGQDSLRWAGEGWLDS